MPTKGSALRAEANPTLRTVCASCGKSIPTEAGHPHPLDETMRRETWGLVGVRAGRNSVFATCDECYRAEWRPPGFVRCEVIRGRAEAAARLPDPIPTAS